MTSEESPPEAEPSSADPQRDDVLEMFIRWGIRGSGALRDSLGISEQEFIGVLGQAFADPRGYFLYGALDECQKAAIQLMQLQEQLSGESTDPFADIASRLVTASVLESELARERRLVEVLVDLVLFSQTNEQPYYRHFLVLEELQDLLYANDDLKEFHGARSENVDASIQRQATLLGETEAKLDFTSAWYLSERARPVGSTPKAAKLLQKKHVVFSSMHSRMKSALLLMSPSEKLCAGVSYSEAYGRPSASVHFAANSKAFRLRNGSERAAAIKIGLLVGSILARVHELLGRPEIKVAEEISRALGRSDNGRAKLVVERLVDRGLAVGDFVLAGGYLAEILEVSISKYGNRSYRALYLSERPLPDVSEDWILARYIQPFLTRVSAMEGLDRIWERHSFPPDELAAMRRNPESIQRALRESMVEHWPLMRADMRYRPEAWGLVTRHTP